MFEPDVAKWAGCGLDQLPRSRFFRTMHDRRGPSAGQADEAGYAEGYAKGLSDGAAVQAETAHAQQAMLAAMVDRMEAMARLPAGSVELLLTEATQRIAAAIEAEIDVASGPVADLVARLAESIEAECAIVAAYIHPADLTACQGLSMPFPVQPDEDVVPGCVRLRTGGGWIEDGPAVRLRRFRETLDRQGGQ